MIATAHSALNQPHYTTSDPPRLRLVTDADYDARRVEEEEGAGIKEEATGTSSEFTSSAWPCPEVLWQGVFADVADRVGARSWEVWSGTYAALSAVAHRNVHWKYFGDLYGMGFVLLISPTGSGKSLMTETCADLLPQDYAARFGLQSGPGLIPILTDKPLNSKTGRLELEGRPAILVIDEWSRLAQMGGVQNSTLLEDINSLFLRRRPWGMSRAHKNGTGGDVLIRNPALTICGTTTQSLFASAVSARQMSGGFLNRHLVLPGRGVWQEYTGESPDTGSLSGLLDDLVSHAWGAGREVKDAYAPDAWERFLDLQRHWFLPIMSDPETSEVVKRLHTYFQQICVLYAWSEKAPAISMSHLKAATAAISTSHEFLIHLLADAHNHIEAPQAQKFLMGIEQKVVDKVTREPGITKRKLTQDLRKSAPLQDLSNCVDRLIKLGILKKRDGNRGQVFLYLYAEHTKIWFFGYRG